MIDTILVRGIPMSRTEVYLHQERLGAQLFDESMFEQTRQKVACANVIAHLDKVLIAQLIKLGLTEVPDDIMIEVDIGDPNWGYIPVKLFSSHELIQVRPTKEAPAGRVAWFRYKRYFSTNLKFNRRANEH